MPKYEKAGFLKDRREQLKNTLDEERDILNENEVGEGRGEATGSEPTQDLNKIGSNDIPLNSTVSDNNSKEEDPALETDKEQELAEQHSSKGERRKGPGKPKKESSIVRDMSKCIKFDKETSNRLKEVKYNYDFDFQDVVFLAVNEYLDTHFPKGRANKEDLKEIIRKMEMLNKKIANKK